MKERPIPFSGPMVRAILDGRKTQTRRLVVASPGRQREWLTQERMNAVPSVHLADVDGQLGVALEHPGGGPGGWVRCPYGRPGDRLWVRETWMYGTSPNDQFGCATNVLGEPGWLKVHPSSPDQKAEWCKQWRKRPSIHMPRWASRILLEVTDVRVERLQEISEEDAIAEGMTPLSSIGHDQPILDTPRRGRTAGTHPHVLAMAVLWDTINADRVPWSANPWVWVIGFRRVEAR